MAARVERKPFAATLAPRWAAEGLGKGTLVRGGARLDAAQFNAEDAVVVDVGAAGALAGAVSIPVTALSGPIPNGTTLDFGGAKYATLTAAAAAGATALAVRAIPTALVDADIATYKGTKKKYVRGGTVIGRTWLEAEAGTPYGPAVDTDDEVRLVAFDVIDADKVPDVELYKPGALVKTNFLPQWGTLSATLRGKIRSAYVPISRGVA